MRKLLLGALAVSSLVLAGSVVPSAAQNSRPNIVMLMTDDTGWNDFGVYSGGGAGLGHPTPNVDRFAKEGELVWAGELHGRPRVVHDRAHSHSHGTLSRRSAGRP